MPENDPTPSVVEEGETIQTSSTMLRMKIWLVTMLRHIYWSMFRIQAIEDVIELNRQLCEAAAAEEAAASRTEHVVAAPEELHGKHIPNPASISSSEAIPLPSVTQSEPQTPRLKKCLNAFDLTGIGVGTIIGAGIFVLTGVAAQGVAGPAITLSYLFSGIACMFSGLCYAEFAARVPISGSAYTYAYCTVGELIAWIIGWDLILEYTIGAAAVARGWSGYLNELLHVFGWGMPDYLHQFDIHFLGIKLDFVAFTAVMVITVFLCVGVRESSLLNGIIVLITMLIIVLVIVSGFILADWSLWDSYDKFFPFGFPSIFTGSATIFFAYVGFDAVAAAAEEVKNPQRDLPIGIIASLSISCTLYVLVAAAITLMVPYAQIDTESPLAAAFISHGWKWAQVVVCVGAFGALTTSILGNLMCQPRIFYSMARDGLLIPWFGKVHSTFKTPFNATVVSGLAAGLMSMTFTIDTLSMMVSIGTLMALLIVCCAILTIRYRSNQAPLRVPGLLVGVISLITIGSLSFRLEFHWSIGLAFFLASLFPCGAFLFITQNDAPASFKTPLMPFIPLLGIFFNVFLISNLSYYTWLRLLVWLVIGFVVYFGYSISHSNLRHKKVHESPATSATSSMDHFPSAEEASSETVDIAVEEEIAPEEGSCCSKVHTADPSLEITHHRHSVEIHEYD